MLLYFLVLYLFFLLLIWPLAIVEIIAQEYVIACPGDTISYNCSIQSNSETLDLTWRVTFQGEAPMAITYPSAISNRTIMNSFITTSLTAFRSEEFIHSTLDVTVQSKIPSVLFALECFNDFGYSPSIVRIEGFGEYS